MFHIRVLYPRFLDSSCARMVTRPMPALADNNVLGGCGKNDRPFLSAAALQVRASGEIHHVFRNETFVRALPSGRSPAR